ncbi:MFS transporter [Agrococcus sp. ARC_14]|uniref:MFS transporter n=1 Tax=Agrococcus sp. ARC_14 TaxID=2919927 RepID=UPI001F067FEE|nr:MFS transporter [Agrococcus sp. ARC_14]MCH1882668.1 MFS transporter [Agrococcus sp. ARC_14]
MSSSEPAQQTGSPRGLAVLLATTFLAFLNFTGLLAVVPLWASTGGLGSAGVGSTTGVMMAATVATQLSARWVFRLLSLRAMMIVGAALLGLPTPLYALSTDVVPILLLTAVRGIGFALMVVAGAILIADVAGKGRLGRAASYYGVAGALPNVLALGGGIWAADAWGFPVVFAVTGAAGVLGAILACMLPRGSRATFSVVSRHDVRRIAPTIVLFVTTTAAFGAASTFLPLAGPDATLAALALLAASCAIVLGRLAAGTLADRVGSGRLLVPAAIIVAIGVLVAGLSLEGPAWALLLGCALVGAGFGACQNDSFVVTLRSFGAARRGTASTIWNIAYDGGVGLGAFGLGWVIGHLGHAGAFIALAAAIAAITALCLPAALRHPAASEPSRH